MVREIAQRLIDRLKRPNLQESRVLKVGRYTLHTQFDSEYRSYLRRLGRDDYSYAIVGEHRGGRLQPYFVEHGNYHGGITAAMFQDRRLSTLDSAIGVQLYVEEGKVKGITLSLKYRRRGSSDTLPNDSRTYEYLRAIADAIPQDAYASGAIPMSFWSDRETRYSTWNPLTRQIVMREVAGRRR